MEFTLQRLLQLAAVATLSFLSTNCATVDTSTPKFSTTYDPVVQQPNNPANVSVKLSTSAQRVYVMEGDRVLLATPCSIGKAQTPTPKGNFTIHTKKMDRRRARNPGSGYPLTYWMEFKPGYGMHWGFVKPFPCTHGCVRLPIKSAQKIFALVRPGTPLNIATSQAEDATIGKTLPLLDDSTMPSPPTSYMHSPQIFADAAKGKLYNF